MHLPPPVLFNEKSIDLFILKRVLHSFETKVNASQLTDRNHVIFHFESTNSENTTFRLSVVEAKKGEATDTSNRSSQYEALKKLASQEDSKRKVIKINLQDALSSSKKHAAKSLSDASSLFKSLDTTPSKQDCSTLASSKEHLMDATTRHSEPTSTIDRSINNKRSSDVLPACEHSEALPKTKKVSLFISGCENFTLPTKTKNKSLFIPTSGIPLVTTPPERLKIKPLQPQPTKLLQPNKQLVVTPARTDKQSGSTSFLQAAQPTFIYTDPTKQKGPMLKLASLPFAISSITAKKQFDAPTKTHKLSPAGTQGHAAENELTNETLNAQALDKLQENLRSQVNYCLQTLLNSASHQFTSAPVEQQAATPNVPILLPAPTDTRTRKTKTPKNARVFSDTNATTILEQKKTKPKKRTPPKPKEIDENHYSLSGFLSLDARSQNINLESSETNTRLHNIFDTLITDYSNDLLQVYTKYQALTESKSLQNLIYCVCGLPNRLAEYELLNSPIPIAFISHHNNDRSLFYSALHFSKPIPPDEKAFLLFCASKLYMHPIEITPKLPIYGEKNPALLQYKEHLHCIGFALHLLWINYSICKDNFHAINYWNIKTWPYQIGALEEKPGIDEALQQLNIKASSEICAFKQRKNEFFGSISEQLSKVLRKTLLRERSSYVSCHNAMHLKMSLWENKLPPVSYAICSRVLSQNYDTLWCSSLQDFSDMPPKLSISDMLSFSLTAPIKHYDIYTFENKVCLILSTALGDVQSLTQGRCAQKITIPYFSITNPKPKHLTQQVAIQLLQLETHSTEATRKLLIKALHASLYFLPTSMRVDNQFLYQTWHLSACNSKKITPDQFVLLNLGFTIRIIYQILNTFHSAYDIPSDPIAILNLYSASELIPRAPLLLKSFSSYAIRSTLHSLINDWVYFYQKQRTSFEKVNMQILEPLSKEVDDSLISAPPFARNEDAAPPKAVKKKSEGMLAIEEHPLYSLLANNLPYGNTTQENFFTLK